MVNLCVLCTVVLPGVVKTQPLWGGGNEHPQLQVVPQLQAQGKESSPLQISHSWTDLLLSLWFGFLVGFPALVSLVMSEVRVDPTAIPKR